MSRYRDRVAELLQDETLSFRAIAREVGCSDWTVRQIARELAGDPSPMKRDRRIVADDSHQRSETGTWVALGVTAAIIALMVWAGLRYEPPEL